MTFSCFKVGFTSIQNKVLGMGFAVMQFPCHFFMIESQEPTSSGIKIEVPTPNDGENPYLETPDIAYMMPVIFPGGGASGGRAVRGSWDGNPNSGELVMFPGGGYPGDWDGNPMTGDPVILPRGGSASGDWYKTPVSGEGMLTEIATFCGYASDWTFKKSPPDAQYGTWTATRERFLGNVTIGRVGGGAWQEDLACRRGFDEPVKRASWPSVLPDKAGYYYSRYEFDGSHCGRTSARYLSYPDYIYDSPKTYRDSGEYSLEMWLWDRLHNTQHMPAEAWIEYRCPTFSVPRPGIFPSGNNGGTHQNVVCHCVSDGAWHIFQCRNYDIFSEYDEFDADGVFIKHVEHDAWMYWDVLYDSPGVLSQGEARQHYPLIGQDVVVFDCLPSPLPVILGGGLPAMLLISVVALFAAVNNNAVGAQSDVRDNDKPRKRYMQ